jgi:hypothetical protein
MTLFNKIFAIFLIVLIFIACNEKKDRAAMTANDSDIKSIVDILSTKTIYFGHQSVGYNIIDGINDILKEHNNSIKIEEITKANDINLHTFSHSKNGENSNPKSKIDSFVNFINNGAGKKVNIAFFKFCYVDFFGDSDVDSVFKYYQKNMKELKYNFPKVKFIHFTVPLTVYRTSGLKNQIKDFIKSIIGRETIEKMIKKDNIKRNNFSELIRSTYSKDEVFDLAGIESLNPEGKKELFKFDGKQYESLVPEYTSDGGHLNELGRNIVANALLKFLAKL